MLFLKHSEHDMQSTQSLTLHTNHWRVASLNKLHEGDGLVRHDLSRELGISKGQLVVLKKNTGEEKQLIKHSFPITRDAYMYSRRCIGKLGIRARKIRDVTKKRKLSKYIKIVPHQSLSFVCQEWETWIIAWYQSSFHVFFQSFQSCFQVSSVRRTGKPKREEHLGEAPG